MASKCPKCNSKAYIGLSRVECENSNCDLYVPSSTEEKEECAWCTYNKEACTLHRKNHNLPAPLEDDEYLGVGYPFHHFKIDMSDWNLVLPKKGAGFLLYLGKEISPLRIDWKGAYSVIPYSPEMLAAIRAWINLKIGA